MKLETIDTYQTKGMRRKLVGILRKKGIKNEQVLEAINTIPRHFFIPDSSFLPFAYEDKAFPIDAGQTISQPYTVAFQSELLELKKGEKVLEIGTGSGYQAAALVLLGAKVFTIERQKTLYEQTRMKLPKWGYRCRFFYGDGYKGLPSYAPFDKIIITCGAPYIPEELLKQLKVGGRMVIPVGDSEGQKMILIIRQSETKYKKFEKGDFAFVPMLQDKE